VNARHEDRNTPLHEAAKEGHTEIVEILKAAQNTQSEAATDGEVIRSFVFLPALLICFLIILSHYEASNSDL